MIDKPLESEGYWVGCCDSLECAAPGEDPTFKVQIVDGIVYLHCMKCGSFRTVESHPKLDLSAMQS